MMLLRHIFLSCLFFPLVPSVAAHAYQYSYKNVTIHEQTLGVTWRHSLARVVHHLYPSLPIEIHVTSQVGQLNEIIGISISIDGSTVHDAGGLSFMMQRDELMDHYETADKHFLSPGKTADFYALIHYVVSALSPLSGPPGRGQPHEKVRALRRYIEFIRSKLDNPHKQAVIGALLETLPSDRKLDSPIYRLLFNNSLRRQFDESGALLMTVAKTLDVDMRKMRRAFDEEHPDFFLNLKPIDADSEHYLEAIEPQLLSPEVIDLIEAVYDKDGTVFVEIKIRKIVPSTKQTPAGLSAATITLVVDVDDSRFQITGQTEFPTRSTTRRTLDISWVDAATAALSKAILASPEAHNLLKKTALPSSSCARLLTAANDGETED